MTALAVDNTILSSVATCSTQAALRHCLGYTTVEERAPLRAGTAAHLALARFFVTDDPEAALVAYDGEYKAWAMANVPDGDRLAWGNVRRVLRQWMDTHPRAAWPFRIAGEADVEVPFRVPLAPTCDLVGRLDGLGWDPLNARWVIEIKTTGNLNERWRRRWRMAAQVTGYVWAAQEVVQEPVIGCYVIGLELAKLPDDPKRKCKTHGVVYLECGATHATFEMLVEPRTPEQIAEWKRTALHLTERYATLQARVVTLYDLAKVRMQGQFTGACADCAFANFCGMGRPVAQAATMLRYEPWSPFTHAFGERKDAPVA